MDISIIIPTYEREDLLRETLNRLLSTVRADEAEVIVVNDSERPLNFEIDSNRVMVIRNSGKGVASARNTGAAKAKSAWLWFLDDDIWINREAFLQGLSLLRETPEAAFNFNWIYPPELLKEVSASGFGRFLMSINYTTMEGWCAGSEWKQNALFPAGSLAGATLLISAAGYAAVGGYDATFPLAGAEDYDFSERLRQKGTPMFIEARVTLFHNERHKSSLKGFLKRSKDNAITRRHAVRLGYKSQMVVIPLWKKTIYRMTLILEPLIIGLAELISPFTALEFISFRMYHFLVGLNIYKGYYRTA